jgi:hypothetical protein
MRMLAVISCQCAQVASCCIHAPGNKNAHERGGKVREAKPCVMQGPVKGQPAVGQGLACLDLQYQQGAKAMHNRLSPTQQTAWVMECDAVILHCAPLQA